MASGHFGSKASHIPSSWTEFQRLDARVGQLEGDVQRVHDEVEACSVLVLSLDAYASTGKAGNPRGAGGGGGAQDSEGTNAEIVRLAARMEVLEAAWANRGRTIAKEAEDAISRFEKEIMELWRQVRAQEDAHVPPIRELTTEVQGNMEELRKQVGAVRDEILNDPGGVLHAGNIDGLVKHITAELGKTVADFERRCDRMEDGIARIEAGEVAQRADRQQAAELNRMVELLVQQRREDIFATNNQLREIDGQLKGIRDREEREATWSSEADQLRGEIEDLKITQIPSVAKQTSRTTALIAEGLQALRKEFMSLRERSDAMRPGSGIEDGASLETSLEIARVKAEMEDLRSQVSKGLIGGIDERLIVMRADFSAEVESAVREVRENFADTQRRLAALEPWERESARLTAELRQMKIDRAEERSRWDLSLQDELLAQRAAITEGIETRLAGFRHDLAGSPKSLRAIAPDRNGNAIGNAIGNGNFIFGATHPAGQGGAPAVLGNRIEWALPANAVSAARRARAGRKPEPVVTGELEVAGIRCRLKFYPNGSPLRTVDGYCSLYLMALTPVAVRFHLFAGAHVSPLLECSYDRRRDQGRHDLCDLEEALDSHGGIVIGAEILDVTPLLATSE